MTDEIDFFAIVKREKKSFDFTSVESVQWSVPEGFKYCECVNGFVPHELLSKTRWQCESCEDIKWENEGDRCQFCLYNFGEDLLDELADSVVIHHHDGCHDIEGSCNLGFVEAESEIDVMYKADINHFHIGCLYDANDSWAERILELSIRKYGWSRKRLSKTFTQRCSCPRIKVIPEGQAQLRHYHSYSVVSMDCSNAMEWSYDLVCPKCFGVTSISDGNC